MEISGPGGNSWQALLRHFAKNATTVTPVEKATRPRGHQGRDLTDGDKQDTVEISADARRRMRQDVEAVEQSMAERTPVSLLALLRETPDDVNKILDDPSTVIETTKEDLGKLVDAIKTKNITVESLLGTGKFRLIDKYGTGSIVDVKV